MMQEIIGICFVECVIALFIMLFVFPALKSYAGRALYFGLLAGANLVLSEVNGMGGLLIPCVLSGIAMLYFLHEEMSERKLAKFVHEAQLRGELRMF